VKLHFKKYQATGNDFVLLDNRNGLIKLSDDDVKRICDRHFGVGADGLMLIEKHPSLDFNLVYYNSDGSQSLCGNGTRAAMKMASSLGIVNGKASFNAYDGPHVAEIAGEVVKVKMKDVTIEEGTTSINTGSPHEIRFVDSLAKYPVVNAGRSLRNQLNANVNFVELVSDSTIYVRTYERGVEDETLSCGTGVTAAALAAYFKGYNSPVCIKTLGGDLSVQFLTKTYGHTVTFTDIFLIGPAKMVFEGDLEL